MKLTPGGRLPRAFVRQVQDRYPSWHMLGRPASIEEEDLPPLAALHDLLRHVGLFRLNKGMLGCRRTRSTPVSKGRVTSPRTDLVCWRRTRDPIEHRLSFLF